MSQNAEVHKMDLTTKDNRQRLTNMVLRLFELWGLAPADQSSMLGLSTAGRTTLARYRKGTSVLAANDDLLGRAGHLLGIHKALRMIFPQNKELAYRWVTQPNKRFSGQKPIDVMKQGYEGLLAVRRYLDFERGR